LLLLRFDGLLLLRLADVQLLASLFQLPPRMTRFEPCGRHPRPAQDRAPESFRVGTAHESQEGFGVALQIRLTPFARQPLFLVAKELTGESLFAAAR